MWHEITLREFNIVNGRLFSLAIFKNIPMQGPVTSEAH